MTLLSIFVKVTLVLGAAAAIEIALGRRMSAATRHLIWTLAILGVLLLPPLAGSLPDWSAVQYTRPAGMFPVSLEAPLMMTATRNPRLPDNRDAGRASSATAMAGRAIAWPLVGWTIYFAGVTLLLGRLILQHVWAGRVVRAATPIVQAAWLELLDECTARLDVRRPVRLLRTTGDTMPAAAGVRHASIVLPTAADTWQDDRRRAVLLHELAHVERYDCLTQTLAAIACAAYWIHPGVWWIAKRLRTERELACDDRVLSAGQNARDYAGHLLELAYTLSQTAAPAVAVTMARPRELEGRMLAALDTARNRAIPALRNRLAGLVVLVALTVPVAAATITPRLHDLAPEELRRATRSRDAGSAQAPTQVRPQFEVASLKRTPDDTGPGADFAAQAGGRLHARNNGVANFIANAYGVEGYLLVGGSEWIRADRYDLEAKAPGEPSRPEMMLMLQALLEDRFQLRTHRETREIAAYVMTLARGGARLKQSKDGDCTPQTDGPPRAAGARRDAPSRLWE